MASAAVSEKGNSGKWAQLLPPLPAAAMAGNRLGVELVDGLITTG